MINTQLATVVVVFLGVMLGVLFNNARSSDLSKSLNDRFTDLSQTVNARISDSNRQTDAALARFEKKLERMDENILRLIADHDARLRSLEKSNG
jgi:hypothetical protein